MLPGEFGQIVTLANNLLLQTPERSQAFSVDHGHVDVEDAEQGVGDILGPSCFAVRRPGHADSYAHLVEAELSLEYRAQNAGYARKLGDETRLGPPHHP